MPTTLEAPIVAVTVHPRHARVTRWGITRLTGDHRFVVSGLPSELPAESVRAGGSGPAAIAGVDVAKEIRAQESGPALKALLDQRDAVRARLDELVEHTDLGELRRRLELDQSATAEITLDFRVDVAKGIELSGWRD
ncbi:DUF4140 domain-containing protein [Prauserella cavernicola]|uniref:DUF4140 domain-containing protein n=1 Tax=Prauserella cavernicola TaxID=2800127 RepID=A0A934QXL2_9PSEU|nr:DUF4140 domain-containing protein [Prauserella cavernicola]MBK1788346.1 DUF4140 domain-containing protein [Prauserella cavernicola]